MTNDADMEDAEYVGLTKLVPVFGNGSGIAGTELSKISQEAREKLERADVIIAKGQGNFETIHTCGLNIYYLFLCKCDWFMQRFHAKHLQGMFVTKQEFEREQECFNEHGKTWKNRTSSKQKWIRSTSNPENYQKGSRIFASEGILSWHQLFRYSESLL